MQKKIAPYNKEFFDDLTERFLQHMEKDSEEAALQFFRDIMRENLSKAYDKMGFEKGNPYDFERVVGERDESVGLNVKFPTVSEKRIVYQFWTDPFPGLKGHVSAEKLDATYMDFKVSYLLGPEWSYRTTMHIWKNGAFTEHVIEKNANVIS
jgi:hypothetical protein